LWGVLMDWIKVLNKHILYEYNDLKDSEFAAWIKIMALTAHLEHEPTRKQILSHVNYQTLESLSRKLHDHSIDLSYILHKVLIDVAYVAHRREALKNNTQRYRDNKKPVIDDVMITSQIREEKIREENITPKTKTIFELPEWIKKETWDSFIEMRKIMRAKPTSKAIELLFLKLKKMKQEGQDPNKVLEQSIENNWKGVFPISGGNGNGSGYNRGERTPFTSKGRGKDDRPGGFGLPKEHNPEPIPAISEEQRQQNITRVQGILGKIG
jgi:hypothetical protein